MGKPSGAGLDLFVPLGYGEVRRPHSEGMSIRKVEPKVFYASKQGSVARSSGGKYTNTRDMGDMVLLL